MNIQMKNRITACVFDVFLRQLISYSMFFITFLLNILKIAFFRKLFVCLIS